VIALPTGYLIGKESAPTESQAVEREREAFRIAAKTSSGKAKAVGLAKGFANGRKKGRRSGLEQGKAQGSEAGSSSAGAQLAAIEAEEQRQLEEAAAAGAIIPLSCPPGYVWEGPMTDVCLPE